MFFFLICIGIGCRRGSGGRGFISGAGETELQLQRRRFALHTNHRDILLPSYLKEGKL